MKALFLALAVIATVVAFAAGTAAEAQNPGWYAEIKTWQTGIGAFAGLVAILGGALYNAKLNRDRDTRLRNREIRGLCHALAAELTTSAGNCALAAARVTRSAKAKEDLTAEHFIMMERPVSAIYEANLDKIGLLAELASEVVRIYETLSKLRLYADAMQDVLKTGGPIDAAGFDVEGTWNVPSRAAKNLARRLDAYEPPDG